MLRRMKRKEKQSATRGKLVTMSKSNSFISEQFRTIRTNITFSLLNEQVKMILVTSSTPGEGKSTNAANIAVVFAQESKKVLLVDADLRKPTLHSVLNVPNDIGLSNLLMEKDDLHHVIQETSIEGLHIMTSGPFPSNPAELLSSNYMETTLEEMRKHYDVIIIDAPPLLSVSDAQILGNKCDGTLLIVNTGVSKKEELLKSKEILLASKAKIIGVVLNRYKLSRKEYNRYQYPYTID